ncbi:acyl-CoA synthetase (AMP-forming)/AMP-acid ligase II [Actinocorallia herbida]|uniref:Acyl-CoA synthetase (AMP-forming)/AMP-acid ligase II n=1 Tax=Actinocorallia herbida TaxID=58109 RepID=A0A3N1D495_9ACTN|nr:AMP-binding protein [Actinocorallia herbida]ROO87898.1 acyl-CoA synthetase (AMP-forming)/AMP-acid ligase II [Actinocorallia herbida]
MDSVSTTLAGRLLAAAAADSGSPLVFDTPEGIVPGTVGQTLAAASRVAAGLRERGIGPGDTVAVQLPNRPEAAVAYAAVLLTGATLLPVVHIYGLREIAFVLRQSGARALVLPDRWRALEYSSRIPALREAAPTLDLIAMVGEPAEGTLPWAELESDAVLEPASVSSADIALLCYTSGTTADPKGARHTHAAVLAEIDGQRGFLGFGANTVQLASFPVGHVAGLCGLLRTLLHAMPTVVLDGWDPARALDLIPEYRVTYTSGTPIHLATLLDALETGAPLGTLREYLVGAATVPAELVARADRLGINAFRSYGSTEHPTISSGRHDDPLDKRQFTDGRPTPGTEVRIVDEAGTDVPTATDGEVVCRGPEQFVGYLDDSLDEDTWLPEGWLRTGDIGHLDADGYLTITDRAKDIIIRAGETISSREVEDVLLSCPGVADAAAVAIPDPYYGEKVAAVIVARPGAAPTLETIRAHFAASGLARQKTPERIELRTELPRTPLGKVKKAELRAELRASLSL